MLNRENIKKLIYFFLNIASALSRLSVKSPRVSILMYHSVGNNQIFFTVKERDLARQFDFLKRRGYQVITLSALVQKLKTGGSLADKTVAITFDDGYQDNYTIAWPLLKKYNFFATIFLPTDFIGRTMNNSENFPLQVLSAGQIKDMAASGLIEFGSHTHSHPRLKELNGQGFGEEARQSKEIIERLTGKTCRLFSYPKGSFKEEFFAILKELGYEAAFSVKEGLISGEDNLFALKRNFVYSPGGFSQFKGKLTYSVIIYNWLKNIL